MNDIIRAADLVVIAERARAAALRGDDLDLGDLTRLEGAADRAVRRRGHQAGRQRAQADIQFWNTRPQGGREGRQCVRRGRGRSAPALSIVDTLDDLTLFKP